MDKAIRKNITLYEDTENKIKEIYEMLDSIPKYNRSNIIAISVNEFYKQLKALNKQEN